MINVLRTLFRSHIQIKIIFCCVTRSIEMTSFQFYNNIEFPCHSENKLEIASLNYHV